MSVPPRTRWIAAAAIGLAAGAAAWIHVAKMEPFLDIRIVRGARTAEHDAFDLVVTARGDEPIDEVRVKPLSELLRVTGTTSVRGLSRGRAHTFALELPAGTKRAVGVRVSQEGTASRTYDLPVGDQP
jgi:hypothetical protein